MSLEIEKIPGRSFVHQDREYLYFGGTSYLGLNTNAEFQSVFIKNIKQYGLNHGASRNSNIRLSIFDKAEIQLALWAGSVSALSLSSGYLAGQLLRSYFNTEEYAVFHHVSAHSALRLPGDCIFNDFKDLAMAIGSFALSERKTPVLFLDSISFDAANFPDFDWLNKLPLDKIIVVADDSHGIGVVGEGGSGAYKSLAALNPKELIVCASLNKALAVQAGVIWAEESRIEELKSTLIFAGSSPASPAALATFIDAKAIFIQRLKELRQNVLYFLDHLDQSEHFRYTPWHSAFSYTDNSLTKMLENKNIIVTSFKYHGSNFFDLNRIIISAHHTEEDIDRLVKLINCFLA